MNCREVEERDISERYLVDRLSEPERDQFERHYFECALCFSQLQTGLALQAELRRKPLDRVQASGKLLSHVWGWAPAFAAAIVLLVMGLWWYSARGRQPSQVASSPPAVNPAPPQQAPPPSSVAPSLTELARVEPPPYTAMVLRGAEDEAQESFRLAMQHYAEADYASSIPGLRAAAKASPRNPRFHFYLGACYLLTGQNGPAIESLRKTVSLNDPAYSEPAHFYLAKAYLGRKDVPSAEKELESVIRLHGSLAARAEQMLRQLRR